ncbi:chromate resistance protein ChrB domain-containing protein [Oceanibacterium hippocampi]|uniref:Chromate resistance exported protein n=1 Tax=Oceanibacterium hippocampi TaxID=745714 RepID=A0A1Y5S1B4_9PROT|nr:chromate resistance protein ChrB domain-containing protein [Oceanibacterium hippocampi]SLN27706.1 Chromate resistance exported protein [Oceanibacterium hippocampi]
MVQGQLPIADLRSRIGRPDCPAIIDVRRREAYERAADRLPAARWRDHREADRWADAFAAGSEIVVYCVHGHEVSESAAGRLRAAGLDARALDGGIEGWRAAGLPLVAKADLPGGDCAATRWVTRARPKIDRIACPWFIRRFVDPDARFHFVAPDWVGECATELDAIPFDIPDCRFSHDGENCSFDAFLAAYRVREPALEKLALIIRAADTGRLDLAPEASGLLTLSVGLSALTSDDLVMLERGLTLYDALYARCRDVPAESHGWPPKEIAR